MREQQPNVLVTGANGFIGRAICAELIARGHHARGVVRNRSAFLDVGGEIVHVPDIGRNTDWQKALAGGVEVVIHLAARVHVMHDNSANPLEEFRKVNTEGTEQLARSAAALGVKRFVYVSTIKVKGEQTLKGQRYNASDRANPQDPYAVSKWQAEQALKKISRETGMEVVIVRPPLVYGPGVKGS